MSVPDVDIIFKFMEWDSLSDAQHDLVMSFEEQYQRKGHLSDRQLDVLMDIFHRAAEK